MAILTQRKTWRRQRTSPAYNTCPLTPEEHANVRRVLGVLRVRLGTLKSVAEELNASISAIRKASMVRSKPTAGLALRVARYVDVPMEDVLSGAYPKPGACPMCGRCSND